MTIHTTYTNARARLTQLLDEVTEGREIVIIQRRNGKDVAMIAADELAGLVETAFLLRSPQNAERLLTALGRALKNEGQPLSVEALRQEVGFDAQNA